MKDRIPDSETISTKDILSSFRRYRRALCNNASVFWDHKTCKQWEKDREFFTNKYTGKRDTGFEGADNYAHEQLFLRCCGK